MRGGIAVVVVVGLAACGSPQRAAVVDNEQVPVNAGWKKRIADPVVAAPRPDIDVEYLIPDFHDELRWPLSMMSHPELEPQFEIAQVFAEPGIGWIELCERGVQNRVQAGRNRDELEYLRGWCAAIKGDADAACGKLKPLTTSAVLGLSAATRTDIVNIIASAGDLDTADKLLNKHRLGDVELYDLLAATYLELGRERDAAEMNLRALDTVGPSSSAAVCRRLVKDIMLRGAEARVTELETFATKPKTPDATCVALHRQMRCRLGPAEDCYQYFRDEGIDTSARFLVKASRQWPTAGAPASVWQNVAATALYAHPVAGSEDYAVTALEAAYAARGECSAALQGLLVEAAKKFNEPVTLKRVRALRRACE